jgi:hypothetical protein
MRRICVFTGSNLGAREVYVDAARCLGHDLARRGLGLVYGGGCVGLMGVLADAVLERGGHVTGVIPEALVRREVGHTGLPDLRIVGSMHERKLLMAELADGFVAMPGGFGTLDEIFEILTWAQLGIHSKPAGFLNVLGYFDSLLRFLDETVTERFVSAQHRQNVLVDEDAGRLLDALERHRPADSSKWLDAAPGRPPTP